MSQKCRFFQFWDPNPTSRADPGEIWQGKVVFRSAKFHLNWSKWVAVGVVCSLCWQLLHYQEIVLHYRRSSYYVIILLLHYQL